MEEETECATLDWQLPLAFAKNRHTELIEGVTAITQTWRMKERMKTVSVALVLCLNVGVDPPDIVKTQPCARLECWIDPLSLSPAKALETIGANMQKQYERWQPRARYKPSLDPTAEEVKKLCTSLRRSAKEERVLFHYNGHGVPKPTANGEIWVFNRTYTQYIPLSVYDLQTWMGAPSIYVYDCSNAGIIVDSFKGFAEQHEKEYELSGTRGSGSAPCFKNCIQLAACSASQILPMNPDLPADIFTSCLTTPIKIALRWFVLQKSAKLVPKVNLDLIDKIPGQLNDRRTMLGELNWIFTAITDTIAWNTLPRDLFQKLFRQDLLVASLFRNFLLAERILRSYDCTPVSSPRLPQTHQHPMWHAWDLALDLCLAQLPGVLEDRPFQHSAFFQEQLTAFQVWLHLGSEMRAPPEQLPVVLQVLLSQVHRLRALELLGRFLDLGPWAVNLALSVGIFPYVLKLLQSSARELRPLLVFIWAKILAVDSTCQAELVRDNGHKYFLSVLQDQTMPSEHRTLAAFVLASVVNNYPQGQEVALQGSLVSICLVQLADPSPLLRQWLAICLGRLWTNYAPARWCGVRDIAHEKLYNLLADPVPEVRAAAVYALGTFISSVVERSEHANTIDHSVAMKLLNTTMFDMSPLVRKELIIALQSMVLLFEKSFISVALQEGGRKDGSPLMLVSVATDVLLSPATGLRRNASRDRLKMLSPTTVMIEGGAGEGTIDRIKRVSSSSSISSMGPGSMASLPSAAFGSIYQKLWAGLAVLEQDPYPGCGQMAKQVMDYIREQVKETVAHREISDTRISSSVSLPPSPSSRPTFLTGESPPTSGSTTDLHRIASSRPAHPFVRNRKTVPNTISEESDECSVQRKPVIHTNFVDWSCKYFAQPIMRFIEESDTESNTFYEREWRYSRNATLRTEAKEELRKTPQPRIENQVFHARFPNIPSVLLFQPYDPIIAIAGKDSVGLYDYYTNTKLAYLPNTSNKGIKGSVKITALDLVNPHDMSLLLVGADDGSVRLWNHQSALHGVASSTGGLSLVSSWQALAEAPVTTKSVNASSGLVVSWEQRTLTMFVSGDVKVVRLWDANQELRVRDIPTECNHCVTSLSSDGQLVVAGCGDGSVRVFDCRLSQNDARVHTWRENNAWVVNCALIGNSIISGSVTGDVRFFDLRQSSTPHVIHTSQEMTAMAIHKQANVFSCGSLNQLAMYDLQGRHINTIKYHEGFMGARIGAVSCLAFHPQRAGLAAGSVDASVSIYAVDPKR